jgi:hypothetical protein
VDPTRAGIPAATPSVVLASLRPAERDSENAYFLRGWVNKRILTVVLEKVLYWGNRE